MIFIFLYVQQLDVLLPHPASGGMYSRPLFIGSDIHLVIMYTIHSFLLKNSFRRDELLFFI
jgi:hypothetical protein